MSFKPLILILLVLGAVAAVTVSFAAGSGGNGQPGGVRPGSVERSKPSNPKATEKYWTPDRMKRARPLPIGIPGGGAQPGGSGGDGGSTAPSHR